MSVFVYLILIYCLFLFIINCFNKVILIFVNLDKSQTLYLYYDDTRKTKYFNSNID